jgi:predicted Zn-dependent protease with MMP-like domain
MTFEDFQNAVTSALNLIPGRFRKILKKEGIPVIAREQAPDGVKKKYLNSIVFGIFIGIPHPERSAFAWPQEPTRIEIYQESFEAIFGPEFTPEVEKQIQATVIHEIAHYFGISENEIRKLGY